jgi:four helix bundle protein
VAKGILAEKSFAFSKLIVKIYEYLRTSKREFTMSKQLLRCGTSIGANVYEAQYGSSKKDFVNKLMIALKECHETEYWLNLLIETNFLDSKEARVAQENCKELKRLLVASCNTAKESD